MKKTDIINIVPMNSGFAKNKINKKYKFIDKKEYITLLETLKNLHECTEETNGDYTKEYVSVYKNETIIDRELIELIIYYLKYLEK